MKIRSHRKRYKIIVFYKFWNCSKNESGIGHSDFIRSRKYISAKWHVKTAKQIEEHFGFEKVIITGWQFL